MYTGTNSSEQSIKEPIKIHSNKLNLDFTVFVENDDITTKQKCYILTVHDIGADHTSFKRFINCSEMVALKERIIWIHVDLPGQEAYAPDLAINKYPSMIDLGDELSLVLDHFKIQEVVCFGEGAGAVVCTNFAIENSNRCIGTVLIHPTGQTNLWPNNVNGVFESFKEKLKIGRGISRTRLNSDQSFLIVNKFGQNGQSSFDEDTMKEYEKNMISKSRNQKNLSMFLVAFLARSNISEKIKDLSADVLTVVGKKSQCASETKKFYRSLQNSRKDDLKTLVNCPFLEIEDAVDVISDYPEHLAVSLQFFLQGIGLLASIPMQKGYGGEKKSRILTMQEADQPKRVSIW